ncbi:MAG: hypothetical protein ACOC2W_02720 [bacterium]
MKVIKINKSIISGTINHYKVLFDDDYSDELIDSIVSDWCDEELSGMHNGYSYEWSVVEDPDLIKSVLKKELKIIEVKMDNLKSKRDKIEKYLKYDKL